MAKPEIPLWRRIPATVRKAFAWVDTYWKPAVALFGPLLYMVVFQVTPWSAYAAIKNKRDHVRFHDGMAQDLLKRGHYARAREEFRQALALDPTDYEGLNGTYLSDLFLELDSPSLEPAVGIGIQRRLDRLGLVRRDGYREIVIKYLADLDRRIGEDSLAGLRYDSAIAIDSNYLDALYAEGWRCYETGRQGKMLRLFGRMVAADSFDFRGRHGYGYALYMRAVARAGRDTLSLAAEQSLQAAKLSIINRLNVVMDLGEIARPASPSLALFFHQWARRMLGDSVSASQAWNKADLNVCLLEGRGPCLRLENEARKRAWVDYQLSLDYEALRRSLEAGSGSPDSLRADSLAQARDSSLALLGRARALDRGGKNAVERIYLDQLGILDRFLPARTSLYGSRNRTTASAMRGEALPSP